jgi:hypothetical protein
MPLASRIVLPLLLAVTFAAAFAQPPRDTRRGHEYPPIESYDPALLETYRDLRSAASAIEEEEAQSANGANAAAASPANVAGAAPVARRRRGLEASAVGGTPVAGATEAVLAAAEPAEPELLYLLPCSWDPELTSSDPMERALEYVARRAAYIEHNFRGSNHPPELWTGALRAYENQALARAAAFHMPRGGAPAPDADAQFRRSMEALEQGFAATLEERRIRSGTQAARVSIAPPCINAIRASPYLIGTAPANGRVWLISAFRFHLCQARRLDPWNLEACDYWREVHSDQPATLAGRFRVQARWPGGTNSRGDRSFEYSGENPVRIRVGQNPP